MKTITLSSPITRGKDTINDISVRSPRGGELRGVSLSDLAEMQTDVILKIIPRISTPGLTEEESEKLSAIDLLKIGAALIGSNDTDLGNASTPKQ